MPGVCSSNTVTLSRRLGFLPALLVSFLFVACTPEQDPIQLILAERFADHVCGEIPFETEEVDLNADGTNEVFVHWGNSCTSGATGRSLSLFIKDSAGNYQDQFGFPAFGYTALANSNDGYPDLQFGGPGFCFGVWAWSGERYEFKCNAPQEEGGCQFTGNVCQSE